MMLSVLADRQLGLPTTFSYDNVLKRLNVDKNDTFLSISPNGNRLDYNPFPPLFACKFAETRGFEHFIALANEDGRVAIQDTEVKLHDVNLISNGFQCHSNAVFDLAWMPNSMKFVTVSGDHSAKLWDIESGSVNHILDFHGHYRSVRTAAFRREDPKVFATGARDGKIMIWDTRMNNIANNICKPDNIIHNSHPYNVPKTPGSGSRRTKSTDRTNSITGLVFQDDYTLISCGSGDGSIRVWDLRRNYSNYKKDPLPKHSISYCGGSSKNGYSNLLLDKSRMRLFASCVDNVIYCFNVSAYNIMPEQKYVGHENGSFYIKSSLSPDSKYLVSGSSDHSAYIWNVKYGDPIIKLTGHDAEVTCATWCQVGDIKIITCSDDARHKIWRIGKERLEDSDYSELSGVAHSIPSFDKFNKVKTLDRTPQASKRKSEDSVNDSPPKQHELGYDSSQYNRRLKRSLIDPQSNTNPVKRRNLDTEFKNMFGPSTSFEQNLTLIPEESSSAYKYFDEHKADDFVTPTKHGQSSVRPPTLYYYSPTKIHNSPTANLPNFVSDGRAPHLRMLSPKKKKSTIDWLTKMRQEKSVESLKKENLCSQSRDVEVTKHLDKSKDTLFKYFSKEPDTPLADKTNKCDQRNKRTSVDPIECDNVAKVARVESDVNSNETNGQVKSVSAKQTQLAKNKTILSFFSVTHDESNKK